jgi:hypothetical protein
VLHSFSKVFEIIIIKIYIIKLIMKLINNLNVLYYLTILYICYYYYEIQNKNSFLSTKGFDYEFVCLITCAQIEMGLCYIILLWYIPDGRNFPKNMCLEDIIKLIPSGICSALSHFAFVYCSCSRYGNDGI